MSQESSNFITVVANDEIMSLIDNDKNYLAHLKEKIISKLPNFIKELEIRHRRVKDSIEEHNPYGVYDLHPGVSVLPEEVINAITISNNKGSILVNWKPIADYLEEKEDTHRQKKFDKIDQFITENIELPKTHLVEGHNSTSNGRVSQPNETALRLSASGRGI